MQLQNGLISMFIGCFDWTQDRYQLSWCIFKPLKRATVLGSGHRLSKQLTASYFRQCKREHGPFFPWLRLSYAHSFSQWIDIMHIAFHNKKADFVHIFFQSVFMLRTNFCTYDWKFFLFLAFSKFMYFLDCLFFIFFQWCTSNNFGCKSLGGSPLLSASNRVDPDPVRHSVVWFLRRQTQQRPPRFSSCRYLSDISTGARNLVRTVCTFPLWRNVRGFGFSSPLFIVIVSFSPMWYSPAIMAILGCNALRACFLTSMEQEMFFKCNIYFDELDLNFLWMLKWWRATPQVWVPPA